MLQKRKLSLQMYEKLKNCLIPLLLQPITRLGIDLPYRSEIFRFLDSSLSCLYKKVLSIHKFVLTSYFLRCFNKKSCSFRTGFLHKAYNFTSKSLQRKTRFNISIRGREDPCRFSCEPFRDLHFALPALSLDSFHNQFLIGW